MKIEDKSSDEEALVLIEDPTGNAVAVVRVWVPTKGYTQAELGDLLKNFINSKLGSFPGFSMGEVRTQKDGSMGLYFKYDSVVDGKSYPMNGDSFIEQHNGIRIVPHLRR